MPFPDGAVVIEAWGEAAGTVLSSLSNWDEYGPNAELVTDSTPGRGKLSGGNYFEASYNVSQGPDTRIIIPIVVKGSDGGAVWCGGRAGPTPGTNSVDRDGYQAEIDFLSGTDNLFIKKYVDNTPTQMGAAVSQEFVSGDWLGLEILGSVSPVTVNTYRWDGSTWTLIGTRTDASAPWTGAGTLIVGVADPAGAASPLRLGPISFGTAGSPAPANTVPPAVTGTPQTGQTLTSTQGTWSNTPTSFAFQWKRAGVAISGATSSTYVLQVADEGTVIKCTVTATNASGSTSADSNTVNATAAPASPSNTVLPAITGSPQTGQVLACSNGTWTGTPTITFAYAWKRDGIAIGGATSSSYTLTVADEGHTITCTVTATNGSGSVAATAAGVAATSSSLATTVLIRIGGVWTEKPVKVRRAGAWVG